MRDAIIRGSSRPADRRDRLHTVDRRLGPFFAMLGPIFLIIILIDISDLPLTDTEARWIRVSEFVIYGIFLVEVVIRLAFAPAKVRFLRQNWLAVLVLALPMLQPLAAILALPIAASGLNLTAIAIIHRGFSALRQVTRGRQLLYVVSLTVTVVLLSAGTAFYFERYEANSSLTSLGESLWWAATLVTTINGEADPVSIPGRIVAIGLRVYAVSVFGYITAFIATWLIGIQEPGELRLVPSGRELPGADESSSSQSER